MRGSVGVKFPGEKRYVTKHLNGPLASELRYVGPKLYWSAVRVRE